MRRARSATGAADALDRDGGEPRPASRPDEAPTGLAASLWMLLGVSALFASAIYRLGERGLETIGRGLTAGQWVALVALTAAFVYGEGFRALDRRWVPGLLRRARRIRGERRVLVRVLAPLYGLLLIGGSRGQTVIAWAATAAIVLAVVLVQSFPAPWRGITDFAVSAALLWGLWAILRGVPAVLE